MTAYEVQQNRAAAVRVGKGGTLQIQAGRVWLTRSGDANDYWLDAGACLSLKGGETLWISAEDGQTARLLLRRPAHSHGGSGLPAFAWRWARRALVLAEVNGFVSISK